MVKAMRVHEFGGPEALEKKGDKAFHHNCISKRKSAFVPEERYNQHWFYQALKWEDVEVPEPGPGQVRIRHTVVGLNFIDTYFRKGIYKTAAGTPFVPGNEGVGRVTHVGPGVSDVSVGDRVGYMALGSYCEERVLDAKVLIPIPDSIDDETAAACLLKGLTAWYLLRRCFRVQQNQTILVHAAAGGTGSFLCQWAKVLGATVIGTVSSEEKAKQAREDGCNHPILYTSEDFVARVREITGGALVPVVYDSVGKTTLMGSLDCLARRGMLVSFGQSSGMPDPLPLSELSKRGSLFVTRPSLMDYTSTREELLSAADELFAMIADGLIKVRLQQRYALQDAARAHADLESRKTAGSTVLTVA